MSTPSIVALIPARAGSKRVKNKNMRLLCGVPLFQWSVRAAFASGIFSDVCVCTEDYGITEWCFENSAARVITRSEESATDDAPDIRWVKECLPTSDAFAILRPTSPFRTAETIKRAWRQFLEKQPLHSLRAIQPVKEHPCKMWFLTEKGTIAPVTPVIRIDGTPAHSVPTQTLQQVYVQNASLEIAWVKTVTETGTISGKHVSPFFTEGHEGFDINTEDDWAEAERLMAHQPMEFLG